MISYFTAIVLGLIEGVTEFLPVSSTGHLLIAEQWLPRQSDLFNVVIQCGAVLAVLAVFWRRSLELLSTWSKPETRDYLLKLGTAFALTAIGGLALTKAGFKLPKEIAPIAWASLIGGMVILLVEWRVRGGTPISRVTWPIALAVAARIALAELLLSGTTTVADHHYLFSDTFGFDPALSGPMEIVGRMLQQSFDRDFAGIITAYRTLPASLQASPVAFFHYINAVYTNESTDSELYRETTRRLEDVMRGRDYALAYWQRIDGQRRGDRAAELRARDRLVELLDDYELLER